MFAFRADDLVVRWVPSGRRGPGVVPGPLVHANKMGVLKVSPFRQAPHRQDLRREVQNAGGMLVKLSFVDVVALGGNNPLAHGVRKLAVPIG